jgi:hypothetical protein
MANTFSKLSWNRAKKSTLGQVSKSTAGHLYDSVQAMNMKAISLGRRGYGKGLNPETSLVSKIGTGTTITGMAVGVLGTIGMKTVPWLEKSRMNILKATLPNTAYPSASGKFGVRTGGAGPAGIEGMRFNFRRR